MACCMTMVFQLYLPRINDRFCWAIGIDIHIALTSFHTLNFPVLSMSSRGRMRLKFCNCTPKRAENGTSIFQMMDKYKDDKQLLIGKGYNNAFLLNDNVSPAVELESMPGGITMKLFTDQPCVVFYSGGFLGNSQMQDGSIVTPSCALAFEAQNYPDLPNTFPSKFIPLMPGETFSRYIQFELSETTEES